jgi:hypothetical protein
MAEIFSPQPQQEKYLSPEQKAIDWFLAKHNIGLAPEVTYNRFSQTITKTGQPPVVFIDSAVKAFEVLLMRGE